MSYAELLETPNPIRYSGVPTEPLPTAIDSQKHVSVPDRAYDSLITDAGQVLETVRKTLHFEKEWTHSNILSPENVARQQTTDCLGYVAVASEALESANIPHLIGYVDTHVYIGLANDVRTRFYMATVENPSVNGAMDNHLFPQDTVKIPTTLQEYGRAAARFNTHTYIARETPYEFTSAVVARAAPWIRREATVVLPSRGDTVSNGRLPRPGSTTTTFFEPLLGRRMIEGKAHLNYATGQKDLTTTAKAIVNLGILYPEANVQFASQWFPRAVIRALLNENPPDVTFATAVNDSVYEALSISGDARARVFHAWQLAIIGKRVRSKEYLEQAVAEFDEAFETLRPTRDYVNLRNKAAGRLALL